MSTKRWIIKEGYRRVYLVSKPLGGKLQCEAKTIKVIHINESKIQKAQVRLNKQAHLLHDNHKKLTYMINLN